MASEVTTRDRVWDAVLQAMTDADGDAIRAQDVRANLPDEMAYMSHERVMWAMCDLGYLSHEQSEHAWIVTSEVDVRGGR